MTNDKYVYAGMAALGLALFFGFAWGALMFLPFLGLAALCGILMVLAFMRAYTTSNCPACKSTIPKGATICRSCRTQLA